jgi:hypothetical protein
MSHINEIDILIYESINEINQDLKDEKLSKIKSFGKEDLYTKLIEKYINKNNSIKKIKELLKNKEQVQKITNIIEKYIIIYCILYFGIQLNLEKDIENAENVFVANTINISLSNKFTQLTSILNSLIINSYKLYNNILLIIDKNLTQFDGEFIYAKKFIDTEIGTDFIDSISKENKDRYHNLILLIIFRNIYLKEDKTDILKIFEEQNLKNSEFKYITIIDSKFEIIDYSTIESLLNIDEIKSGLTQSLYGLLLDYDNVDLQYISPEKKINELFEKELLIPITDEFLRYHKDSEKYEKIEGVQGTKIDQNEKSNKRNDTKLKYIVTKINKISDYYMPDVNRQDIEKIFYQPMMNRKIVLYNDTEEVAIISKFANMGRVNIENSEFFSDLKDMRESAYINFKNFKNVGFQLKTRNYVDAIRYSNIEFLDNRNLIGSYNRPIELRPLSKNINSNIIGVALPVSLFNNNQQIRCMKLKDFADVRTINDNGYEACTKLLEELLFDVKNREKIMYWIFDIEKDKLITEKYQNVSENNFESYLKTLLDNIYNKLSTLTYEILTNEINQASSNIYYLKKLIGYIQDRFIQLNVRDEYYAKVQKLLYYIKLPKVKDEYDKDEDKIPGVNSPLIKIPKIPKLKETEKIVEIFEEEIQSSEDLLLQNATCQHIVTFNKILMLKNRDPSVFDQALYEFIKKYKRDNKEGEFICKSCSQLLDIKKFVADTYQAGVFTLNLSTSSQPLEELSKYEKFGKAIKNIDKIIERIAYVMNMNMYVGSIPIVRLKRQEITKTTIDLIETTNLLIRANDPAVRKQNLENAEKIYGINKSLTNYFLFKLDNEIFVYTSQDTDKYKKFKYNNILSYIMLLMILDISNNQTMFLTFDKNYNYLLFNKFGFGLFNNIYVRINNSNDVEPIKNYKILCYLIYYFAGMMVKFNIWYFDQQTKDSKSFSKIGIEIIINTLIHLLNTITEAFVNNKNNYLFDTISTRFFLKLNTQFNNNSSKEILDKIELLMSEKIEINNNKIRIRVGTQHPTNDLNGKIESFSLPYRKYVTIPSLISNTKQYKDPKILIEPIKEKLYQYYKKKLFEKFNIDGSKKTIVLTEEELNARNDKDIEKLDELLRLNRDKLLKKFNKIENIRILRNEKKINKEEKFIKKMEENYKKYYDSTYDKLIKIFVDKLESIIGDNININNENIYLKENTYILDHNYLGQSTEITVIKDVSYKPNNEHFKQDVLIVNKDKNEIYYSVIENNLLGYKEKGKNYVDVKGSGKFIKVNYSIENKLKYLGFDNKYININDYQIENEFTKEKPTHKEILDEIMRNRINALKKLMEFSQKIIYQIKNKKNIQMIEKTTNLYDKNAKNKPDYFAKRELNISKDSQIVLNFQSKFKYINTTKENNKKILVNWTLLNEGIQLNTDFKFNDKDLLVNNKYIDASHLISLKNNDHIIIFYTLSELAYLIDLNDDNYTKSNLVFLIANIINYCYTIFNKQLNHIEYRRFKYMIESVAETISFDQTTELEFHQTEEQVKVAKELNEDVREEKDALDIEQDLPDEELDDPDTEDEHTKFEVHDA